MDMMMLLYTRFCVVVILYLTFMIAFQKVTLQFANKAIHGQ